MPTAQLVYPVSACMPACVGSAFRGHAAQSAQRADGMFLRGRGPFCPILAPANPAGYAAAKPSARAPNLALRQASYAPPARVFEHHDVRKRPGSRCIEPPAPTPWHGRVPPWFPAAKVQRCHGPCAGVLSPRPTRGAHGFHAFASSAKGDTFRARISVRCRPASCWSRTDRRRPTGPVIVSAKT